MHDPAGDGAGSLAATRRSPSQARGELRVARILDAAAELVMELGLEGVTMSAIRERSGSATGSLYHFFPDRDAVLRALAARHTAALMETVGQRMAITPEGWGAMPLAERVDLFLDPLFEYSDAHPDFLYVFRGPPGQHVPQYWELYEAGVVIATRLVEGTDPAGTEGRPRERASVIMATLDGVMQASARSGSPSTGGVLREYRSMLIAYLAAGGGR